MAVSVGLRCALVTGDEGAKSCGIKCDYAGKFRE